jgi:hypothetical protein
LPTKAKEPPCGGLWWHEIKHNGFRIIARKDGSRVRLFTRNDRDFTHRFPLIVDALTGLRSRSCILDGEAVCSIQFSKATCRWTILGIAAEVHVSDQRAKILSALKEAGVIRISVLNGRPRHS